MTVGITALCDGRFVAEVSGTDFSGEIAGEVPPDLAAVLRGAFVAHPVLVMHCGGLTPAQLLLLAGVFGEPQEQLLAEYRTSDTPTISVITSEQTDVRGDGRRIVFGGSWHTDDSYLAVPAKATMLYAHVIPPTGGDTLFADTTAAYEALDASHQAELAELRVVHCYQSRRNINAVPTRSANEEAQTPPAEHPLVRTHPETGQRSLYLNPNRMDAIVGLDEAASDRLLDRLIEHSTQERFVHRHVWRPHDVVIWDNGRTMHRATADYGAARREMHRILLGGTVPV